MQRGGGGVASNRRYVCLHDVYVRNVGDTLTLIIIMCCLR